MSTVVLVVHPQRADAQATARELAEWLDRHGHRIAMTEADAELASLSDTAMPLDDLDDGADLAISIGGDGTMLHTVALVARHGIPVLGINSGRLGYLTAVGPDRAVEALVAFFAGDHRIEERMRIELTLIRRDGTTEGPWDALNEAVVEKREQGHTVRFAVDFNGERFSTYSADGLIVATATGSTAYSMSARGPILEPGLRALLFTPVSPHTLFDRSLVLDPNSEIRIGLEGSRDATLSIDGRATASLVDGDVVLATESTIGAKLVTVDSHSFHSILKSKFGLRENAPGEAG